jgi:hypothetical protein
MGVYITPNVPIMEILYAVPCEACSITEEYTAVKEGIFTTMTKEPLARFLAWEKTEWT